MRVKISELIIVIPVMHIIISSLFLVGYHTSFGSGIASFSSPNDLFSVSISEIGPAYITTLAFPIIQLLFFRAYFGGWTMGEAIAKKDAEARILAEMAHDRNLKILWFVLALITISQIAVMWIFWSKYGYITYSLFYSPVVILFVFANSWLSSKFGYDSFVFQMVYLVGAMLLSAGISGLSKGQSDRHAGFSDLSKHNPVCENYAVIRQLSTVYLAVRNDGRKVLIDMDCKVKFYLGTDQKN